jgi:hypothetical protein
VESPKETPNLAALSIICSSKKDNKEKVGFRFVPEVECQR